MRIFAQINDSNTVIDIALFDDDNTPDDLGLSGWIETNSTIHNRQAAPGDTYVPDAAIFYGPSPHSGWVIDDDYEWQPPEDKPYPEGFGEPPCTMAWDDDLGDWDEKSPADPE
jgi:hypothetical protein